MMKRTNNPNIVTQPAARLTAALIGRRVGAVDGPGQNPRNNPGTVIDFCESRFGNHLVVKLDSGRGETVHNFVEIGIGWYLL